MIYAARIKRYYATVDSHIELWYIQNDVWQCEYDSYI